MPQRPLNVGIIGGGGGAFIVNPHQKAIFFDGTRRVSAAALMPDPAQAMEEAENWNYPIQGYPSYDEMLEEELKKPLGERIDYVLIVTPNFVHYDPAKKFLEAGIPVFCEKPLTITVEESQELAAIANSKNIPFCVAHTYLGHWTTRFARHIVKSGLLGDIRWADSSYIQGWLASRAEEAGVQQAEWRVDPKRAGASGCGGDIGTHAYMHLCFITGLEVEEVSAFLVNFVEGRALDDHFTTYCKLSNGGKAMIRASQISIGHKNDMGIEINGDKGSLIWEQENPEKLVILLKGQPERTYWRGDVEANDGFLGDLPEDLMSEPTIPSGHTEGFHDAFARLHRYFEVDVRSYLEGKYEKADGSKYAVVDDGVKALQFISAAVESNNNNNSWVKL
ncbi:MAG: Gfo/Idh/MocA family oxidoreductase [Planctomycetes bacterium]|nr:Gfo/Idh/MocA family oxidoreductase [Planctomycetota bacterium]